MSKALATKNVAAVLLGIGMILSVFAFATPAKANPSIFANSSATSAATTSPAYMTPGAATSTVYFDAYDQTFSGGQTFKADDAALFVQFTASGTLARLNIAFEYADLQPSGADCNVTPAACDWYRYFPMDPTATSSVTIGNPYSINWQFASSTNMFGITPTSSRSTAVFPVQPIARYTRAIASLTGANAAVWLNFRPVQQVR